MNPEADGDESFELLSSQPEKAFFDRVPSDKVFKFKLIPNSGNSRKICYKLKAGTELPHVAVNVGGRYGCLSHLLFFISLIILG